MISTDDWIGQKDAVRDAQRRTAAQWDKSRFGANKLKKCLKSKFRCFY